MASVLVGLGVINVFLLVAFCFSFKMWNSTSKKLTEAETEIVKLKSDIEWEKTKAQVKRDVENEVHKKNEKLESGSMSDRINAADSVLRKRRN